MADITGGDTNNALTGSNKADLILGMAGADTISGGQGGDVLFGDKKSASTGPKPMGVAFANDVEAKITFLYEDAGHRNALGLYVAEADGTISNVRILFANASLKGSGGDLGAGVSAVTAKIAAGQSIGFFIAPDAYSRSAQTLLKSETFEMRDSGGKIAKINDAADMILYGVGADGASTAVNTANGTNLLFQDQRLNGDGLGHVAITKDAATTSVKIGFEDLWGGGDRDFDDVVFQVDVGKGNLANFKTIEPPKVLENLNDVINAGEGDDQAYGNGGNDRVNGENGNDMLDGGSGNDTLVGGRGSDTLYGRSGDDALYGEDGDDVIEGSSGNDRIWDGAGNDLVKGGTGRDTVFVGLGNDTYVGGDGFDVIDFSASKLGLDLDVSKKTATMGLEIDQVEGFEQFVGTRLADKMRGDKNANTFMGGDGDDWFRGLGGADSISGGAGRDTFAYSAKDVWFEKVHLGVDRIRDFNAAEDKLDLFEITKNLKTDHYAAVKLEQTEGGTMVWADLGAANGDWQKVVQLDGLKAEALMGAMKDWLIV